jgi:adenylosuccinate lyase
MGVAFGHSGLALRSARRGLDRVSPAPDVMSAALADQWEVLAEAIQTVMRRYGWPEPYERLKALTRGQEVSEEEVRAFVAGLGLPADAEARLLAMTPASYVGLAPDLVRVGRAAVTPARPGIPAGDGGARSNRADRPSAGR